MSITKLLSLAILLSVAIFANAQEIDYVYNKQQLDQAFAEMTDVIYIMDKQLADEYYDVDLAYRSGKITMVTIAVAAGGIAIWNEWNPVGWGASIVSLLAMSSTSLSAALSLASLGYGILNQLQQYDASFTQGYNRKGLWYAKLKRK